MILQRPQALYFFLCSVFGALAVTVGFSDELYAANTLPMYLVTAVSAVSFVTIFLFKHLRVQSFAAKVVLLTDAIVFIILAYRQLNLSGGVSASEKGIEVAGLLLLFASMVSALAASRAVKKDLHLVKSSGRLR